MMNVKESVQQQFGSVAAHYATSAVHAGGPDLQAMLDAVTLRGDERVLDVGSGTGHTALAFAPRVAAVIAVDLTAEMLEQGRRLAAERGIANVAFQRGDVEHLDHPAASFDLVTSRYSAHHYPHPAAAIHEIRRVLKADGVFLLVDVVAPDDATADTFLNAVELLRDRSHVRDHSAAQWGALLGASGCAPEVLETWPLRLEFDTWIARMHTPPAAAAQIKALFDG
jgi:ubiquinone/menaquinone biosynthesis C-methylase UbiE